jgi:hypothetical protein
MAIETISEKNKSNFWAFLHLVFLLERLIAPLTAIHHNHIVDFAARMDRLNQGGSNEESS